MIAHTYQMSRAILLSQGRTLSQLDLPEMEAMARGQGKSPAEVTMLQAAMAFVTACQAIDQKGASHDLAR